MKPHTIGRLLAADSDRCSFWRSCATRFTGSRSAGCASAGAAAARRAGACPGQAMAVQATGVYTQKLVPEIVINGQPAPGAIWQPGMRSVLALPCGRANHDVVRRNRTGSETRRAHSYAPQGRHRVCGPGRRTLARRGARRVGAFLPDLDRHGSDALDGRSRERTITSATTSVSRRGTSSCAPAREKSRNSPDA